MKFDPLSLHIWCTAPRLHMKRQSALMYELSQPTLSLQRSCSIIFSLSRNGVVRPSGYYMELTADRIPRLMSGLSLRVMRKLNVLFSMFHSMPSTRLGEVDHRVCTCDAMGTSSTTSLLLEVNLWSLKLPLIHSSVLFLISLIASCTVGIDLSPSST